MAEMSEAEKGLEPVAWAELRAFLDGSAPLDGVWFGDTHPRHKGNFWWRRHLPQAHQPTQVAPVGYVVGWHANVAAAVHHPDVRLDVKLYGEHHQFKAGDHLYAHPPVQPVASETVKPVTLGVDDGVLYEMNSDEKITPIAPPVASKSVESICGECTELVTLRPIQMMRCPLCGDVSQAHEAPVASKSVEDCMRLADEYADDNGELRDAAGIPKKVERERQHVTESRAALQAAIVAYGDAQWNDAIEAAAILAQESEGKDQIHERILVLKREPR